MQISRREKKAKSANLLSIASIVALLLAPRAARAEEWPTLERSIQLARAHAIVVADAEAELGVANAQMAGARQSILGNPYTDFQIDRSTVDGQIQALSYTYIPLDLGGQRGARMDEARRMIEWRKLGITDARAQAMGEAVAAYGDVTIGVARVTETVNGEQTAREEARYFAGRLEAKDTTVYEKALADAEVARWVQSRVEAELRLTTARARFGQLTGVANVSTPAAATASTPPGLRGSWDDAYMTRMVDRSPMIASLQAERKFWEASAERYRSERFPPISFEIIGGRGANGEGRYGTGLTLTYPITRRYQGEIARAEQGRNQVVARTELYRKLIETRYRAARDAILSVDKAITELDQNGMPALEKAVTASVDAYKLGKVELTRVLLARRDLSIARSRRLDLLEAAWRAYADLTILSGDLP
ncbi:Heavy metal RND efflux outer membrane protein, CzcC family [Labilithrix luteola]|uniref:Heavy metal RND efflux outer membrane protein, CzcC family n=1 Tax=Labilithrix luteola TaxID=1391654 RepID=A0A0K1PZI0_9BACT|nr:TolC family protein [Labilithrix luteola]AKU98933.1 Heavy metal RND efflux outer membrane protein, CzcC family [Labilithrix luteola]